MKSMGFGSMIKSAASEIGGSDSKLPNVFLDVREGKRTFRFIPDLNNPGEALMGEIANSIWLPVKKDGMTVQRRVFLDAAGERLIPSDSAEKIKRRFFINVYDRTRVVKFPDGSVLYPNIKNEFWKREGDRTIQVTDIKPEPNNKIMVLEGSVSLRADRRGGLLNEIDDLSKTLFDEDGTTLIPITAVDIEMVTRGTGMATTRSVHPGMNRDPFPKSALELPVYDLTSFTKAWPVAAIKELLAGSEYTEVLKAFNIPVIPQLKAASAAEPSKTVTATAEEESLFN
jgi:hypothetical protein